MDRQRTAAEAYRHGLIWRVENPFSCRGTFLHGDAHLLNRMIRNLLDNASRFAKASVVATVESTEERLRISIEDDGPGMTTEEIEGYGKVRNRRLSKAPLGPRMSLGLGAVIVQRIVELHKGRLRIRNRTPRPGIAIEIEFPRESGSSNA